jgi:hypothetical protein
VTVGKKWQRKRSVRAALGLGKKRKRAGGGAVKDGNGGGGEAVAGNGGRWQKMGTFMATITGSEGGLITAD